MLMRRRSVVAWIGGSALLFAAAALLLPFVGPSALDWGRVWQRQEPDWSILRISVCRGRCSVSSRAARWRWRAACSSRCCATRSRRPTRWASRPARRSAPSSPSRSTGTWSPASSGIWAGALAGAGVILFVVMGAATRGGQLSSSSLLLAGIAINSVCAALILLVHGLTGMSQSFAISRWLIGGLDAIERPTLLVYVLVVVGTGVDRHPPGAPVEPARGGRGVGGDAGRAGEARAVPRATSRARSWRRPRWR